MKFLKFVCQYTQNPIFLNAETFVNIEDVGSYRIVYYRKTQDICSKLEIKDSMEEIEQELRNAEY